MIQEVENSSLYLRGPYTNLTPQMKVAEIPSGFLPYPKGSEIFLRKYTGIELRYFSSSSLSTEDEVKFVLDGIQTIGFDREDLTFHDFKFLGLQRRLISMESNGFSITWFCDKCNNQVTTQINTEALQFDELNIPSLPVNAKLSFGEYQFIPITVRTYLEMQKVERVVDENPDIDALKFWIFLMSFHLKDLSIREKFYNDMIERGTERDIRILEEIDKRLYHSIMPIDVVCPTMFKEVNPESGVNKTYDELIHGGVEGLLKIAAEKGIDIPETEAFDQRLVLATLDSKLNLLKKIPCGNKAKIRISSGSENLISPFRGSEDVLDNCISFG